MRTPRHPELQSFTDYTARLVSFELGAGPVLKLAWQVGDDPENLLRVYVHFRFGKTLTRPGPSKLRSILTAVARRPASAVLAYFDDATFQYGFLDGTDRQLKVGDAVTFQGRKVNDTFIVERWSPAP